MSKPARPVEATPRRDFLRTLALAPAAVAAGCATSTGAGPRQEAPSAGSGSAAAATAEEEKSLHALRAHPLSVDAEPALVFRAAPARPVE